jgi:hypothetical protein
MQQRKLGHCLFRRSVWLHGCSAWDAVNASRLAPASGILDV